MGRNVAERVVLEQFQNGTFYLGLVLAGASQRTVDSFNTASHALRQRGERLMLNPVANYKMIVMGVPSGGAVWYRSLVVGGVLLHKRNAIGER